MFPERRVDQENEALKHRFLPSTADPQTHQNGPTADFLVVTYWNNLHFTLQRYRKYDTAKNIVDTAPCIP